MSNIVPLSDMQVMAESIAKSRLFGMTDPNQVLALMAVAQAEGLHPATAARDYHVIQGRPALKADAMLARFQTSGGKVEWKELSDKKATGVFSHPAGGTLELSWTIEQAQSAGLVKPGSGWTKFPRAMLRSRVVSEGIRSVYPGCVVGTYTPEEVQDFDDKPKSKDMGKVEVVEVQKIEDMPDDPLDGLELFLPDGSVYGSYNTAQEWTDTYCAMIRRIKGSQKLSDEVKDKKVKDFIHANDSVRKGLPPAMKIETSRVISEKNVEHKTVAPKDLPQVEEANVIES